MSWLGPTGDELHEFGWDRKRHWQRKPTERGRSAVQWKCIADLCLEVSRSLRLNAQNRREPELGDDFLQWVLAVEDARRLWERHVLLGRAALLHGVRSCSGSRRNLRKAERCRRTASNLPSHPS